MGQDLIGKVVRLHRPSEPNNIKLYLITDDKYTSFSQGKVNQETVKGWIESGLKLTFYTE